MSMFAYSSGGSRRLHMALCVVCRSVTPYSGHIARRIPCCDGSRVCDGTKALDWTSVLPLGHVT